jgi:hypothetical protein
MSQQPTTRREDLLSKARGNDDDDDCDNDCDEELVAFINAISNRKLAELSDRVHHRFWNNDVVWEVYWELVDDEIQSMRDEIVKLNKEPAELGSNI